MKKALFIGRWQPFHDGHKWLINQKLISTPVLIMVRDILPDDKNPFTTQETVEMLKTVYTNQNVEIMVIPDIESVNWGRGVGYEVNEHYPPEDIKMVSATDIRTKILNNDDTWKNCVDPSIHNMVIMGIKNYFKL